MASEDKCLEMRWRSAAISSYLPVPDGEDWHTCPVCLAKPRIWVFDNGRHAKCLCSLVLGPPRVSAISIVEARCCPDWPNSYDRDRLRQAWNEAVPEVVPKAELVEYLGDGVYAAWDGFAIELRANDHLNPTDRVVLEPAVMTALLRFRERVAKEGVE